VTACFAEHYSNPQDPMGSGLVKKQNASKIDEKKSPELFVWEEQNFEIQNAMDEAVKDYRARKIDRDEARVQLKPLIQKQIELSDNKEYRIEQKMTELLSGAVNKGND